MDCLGILNIFILHRLRNKFLQLILISLDSASWELHQYYTSTLDIEHILRVSSKYQNNKDITKCQKFLHDPGVAKAIAIPWLFSENSRAKNQQTL